MAATYLTVDHVRRHLPQFEISTNSRPSTEQVQEFLDDLQARVDSGLMTLGYTVPIVATDAVRVLRNIILDGVTNKVLISALAGVRNPEDFGASGFWKRYEAGLKALADPDNPLTLLGIDLTAIATKVMPEFGSHVTDVSITDPDDIDDVPLINRDMLF